MTKKEAGEKEAEVVEPTEVKPSPEEELVTLRSQFDELQTKVTEAQEEAKAHQRTASKKAEEAQEYKNTKETLQALSDRVEVLTAMQADLLDRGESEEEPRKKSADYLKRLDDLKTGREKEQEKSTQQVYMEKAQEADKLAKGAGLDMEFSPELEMALLWFQTGNADKGLLKVKEVIGKLKPEKKETEEEREARIERKILEKHGLLTPEISTPAGAGRVLTIEDVKKMSPEEKRERSAEIAKLPLSLGSQ